MHMLGFVHPKRAGWPAAELPFGRAIRSSQTGRGLVAALMTLGAPSKPAHALLGLRRRIPRGGLQPPQPNPSSAPAGRTAAKNPPHQVKEHRCHSPRWVPSGGCRQCGVSTPPPPDPALCRLLVAGLPQAILAGRGRFSATRPRLLGVGVAWPLPRTAAPAR